MRERRARNLETSVGELCEMATRERWMRFLEVESRVV